MHGLQPNNVVCEYVQAQEADDGLCCRKRLFITTNSGGVVAPVEGVAAVARVGFFISKYNAYRFNKRTEDEASIRKWLATKLESAKAHALNVLASARQKDNPELASTTKTIIDEIDIFKNDAYLAETGIRGKLFASRSAASVASISKLIEYDARILEEVERATRAMAELEKAIAAGEENVEGGAIRLSSAFTTAHARFRERVKYIRGFGD